MSSNRSHNSTKSCEIVISNLSDLIEPHTLLYVFECMHNRLYTFYSFFFRTYFEQFGEINHYNFLSPNNGGIVFLTYENIDMVNFCMKNRPHRLDGRHM